MQSVRKEQIALLNRMASTEAWPVTFGENSTMAEIALVADFIANGYLQGGSVPNSIGQPCHATVTGITPAGREYAVELEAQAFRGSPRGRLWALLKGAAIWLSGVLSLLVAQALARRLGWG